MSAHVGYFKGVASDAVSQLFGCTDAPEHAQILALEEIQERCAERIELLREQQMRRPSSLDLQPSTF